MPGVGSTTVSCGGLHSRTDECGSAVHVSATRTAVEPVVQWPLFGHAMQHGHAEQRAF